MKIKTLYNVKYDQFSQYEFDLFIMTYRKTERALFLSAKQLKNKRQLILFTSSSELEEYKIEHAQEYNTDVLVIEKNEIDPLINYLLEFINKSEEYSISVSVDYTVMSQLWYSSILVFLNNLNIKKKIDLYFSYTQSKFYKPSNSNNCNYKFQPLKGYSNISIPNKPTALILGVGFENRRAFSLKEYLDAEEVYVFITDKLSAPQFNKEVYIQNRDIIAQMNDDHILEYPVLDILYTRKILYDLCKNLSNDFRVLIAPCGPKTFSLVSAIVAMQIPNIDVWSIIGGSHNEEGNDANGEISHILIEYEI